MTLDDQQKCSEMWEMASGDFIAPKDWTDSAGEELAKYFAAVYNCTNAMSFVPKPSGSAPGLGWIVTHVYNVLKNRFNMNKSLIYKSCQTQGLSNYRTSITVACL